MVLRETALQNGAIAPPMIPKACSTPSSVSASTRVSATVYPATACPDAERIFGTVMLPTAHEHTLQELVRRRTRKFSFAISEVACDLFANSPRTVRETVRTS